MGAFTVNLKTTGLMIGFIELFSAVSNLCFFWKSEHFPNFAVSVLLGAVYLSWIYGIVRNKPNLMLPNLMCSFLAMIIMLICVGWKIPQEALPFHLEEDLKILFFSIVGVLLGGMLTVMFGFVLYLKFSLFNKMYVERLLKKLSSNAKQQQPVAPDSSC